jgi:predicted metal-dependent phosphoesterase TrpH
MKIDLALESLRKSSEETIAIVASKVDATLKKLDESSQETREYFESKVKQIEESNQAARQSILNKLEAKESNFMKAFELIEAKLSKTELALELERSRVQLLEGKIGNSEAEVKSLQEKLAAQAQAINIQIADFVKKQFDEIKEMLRRDTNRSKFI